MKNLQMSDSSILTIQPKPLFLKWLVTMSKYDPGHRPVEQIYNDVDATAWLLPRISSFNSSNEVFAFISKRKAAILKGEVSRVFKGLENFSYSFTEETFDKCFELRIIHNVESIFDV